MSICLYFVLLFYFGTSFAILSMSICLYFVLMFYICTSFAIHDISYLLKSHFDMNNLPPRINEGDESLAPTTHKEVTPV